MPKTSPKISIVLPIHDMKNGAFFLWRAVNSIMEQTFKDYEIIITKEGPMPVNTNAGIKKARGELIKILYMDDWFAHPNALQEIVDAFSENVEWMITGVDDNPVPTWTDDIHYGNNKLGSPSALTLRNHGADTMLFDEKLSWLLDCDLFRRLFDKYGWPKILTNTVNVKIGKHDGQMTHLMSNDYKQSEHEYVADKYKPIHQD